MAMSSTERSRKHRQRKRMAQAKGTDVGQPAALIKLAEYWANKYGAELTDQQILGLVKGRLVEHLQADAIPPLQAAHTLRLAADIESANTVAAANSGPSVRPVLAVLYQFGLDTPEVIGALVGLLPQALWDEHLPQHLPYREQALAAAQAMAVRLGQDGILRS